MAYCYPARVIRWAAITAISMVVVVAAIAADAQVRYGEVQQGGSGAQCCVNNFRFAGTCKVTIGNGESCSDVLSYLNNLQSVGKAYCGGSLVRGGWTQVRCQLPDSSNSTATPGTAITAPPARSPHAAGTANTRPVDTADPTFVTPVDSSTVRVQEAGILNF